MTSLLTPEQVAEYLNVSRKTLYSWRMAGGGPPALKVGKYLRFERAAVDAWLRDQPADSRRSA